MAYRQSIAGGPGGGPGITAPLHEALLGRSEAIREINALVRRLANSDLTVLITGESGTGKDIVARQLHKLSPRAQNPFIKVNCPALPEGILESELFGYEPGAFTGALTSKPGRFELAHTGSIFLDEVAETTLTVQSKLLQVLDGESVMRIGGVRPIQADVRIIAATNMNLENVVQRGRMREDIYFRLSEVVIQLPPLRDRREDIPVLAEHFNYNYCQRLEREYRSLPRPLMNRLQECEFRGNVRELGARIKKFVATANPEVLFEEEEEPRRGIEPVRQVLNAVVAKPSKGSDNGKKTFVPLKEATRRAVEETERSLIEEALRHTLWNRRKAAKLLEISYSSLLRRIDAYNIGKG